MPLEATGFRGSVWPGRAFFLSVSEIDHSAALLAQMKFLHTSDWHVGKTIRGRSRIDEFAAVLDEVVGIAIQERVDAVLMAGDLYEHRAASPDADALVFGGFIHLYEDGVSMVVTSGNQHARNPLEALAS